MQTVKDNRKGGFEGAGYKLFNGAFGIAQFQSFFSKTTE